MTLKISTGTLLSMTTGGNSLQETFDGCEFRIYSGTEPAAANDSKGAATLLCTIDNGGTPVTWDELVPGTLHKAAGETWQGTNAASGTAIWFRIVKPADADDASTSAVRLQGSVGVLNADLNLLSTSLVSSVVQMITDYYLSLTAA